MQVFFFFFLGLDLNNMGYVMLLVYVDIRVLKPI